MALIDKLTAIADAIRGKTGKMEGLTLEQMASEISGIQTGGDSGLLKSIVEGDAETLSLGPDVSHVKAHLFRDDKKLKSFDFTHIQSLGTYAFSGSGLTEAYLPSLTGQVRSSSLFYKCTELKKVSIPNITSLTSAAADLCNGCSALTEVDMPNLANTVMRTFDSCTALEKLDLPKVTEIGSGSFQYSKNLKTLVLRNAETPVALSGVNAFNGTPFAEGGTGGTVYVPQALIPEYRQATNWSTLYAAGTCNFAAIEGSEYE